VIGNEYEIGGVVLVVALIVTWYVPAGVPEFLPTLPPLLPPHDVVHIVENPTTTMSASSLIPRSERLREPKVKTMPISPGSSTPYKIRVPRSNGRSNFVVAAVVTKFTVTAVDWVEVLGLNVHEDWPGIPAQLYIKGSTVVELPPLVVTKPVELATVRLTEALAPGVTVSVPPVRFEVKVNVSVVEATVRLTTVELDVVPLVLVPVTMTEAPSTAAMLVPVWITSVAEVAFTGVKLQVAPAGKPLEQAKVTGLLKPFSGVIVIVVLLLFAPAVALRDVVLGESVKPGCVAMPFHAMAKLFASTEPRPVTRL
jgi:hypothetical protein